MRLLLLASLLVSVCSAYKYLVYSPLFGHSHVTFLGKIADVLSAGGHQVTVLMPIVDPLLINHTGVRLTKRVIFAPQDARVKKLMDASRKRMFRRMWTMPPSGLGLLEMAANMSVLFGYTCDNVINDDQLLTDLKNEDFDVGIAEAFTICGLALFEQLGIQSTIGVSSNTQINAASIHIGEPLAPSYVPSMSANHGAEMSYVERLRNLLSTLMGIYFFDSTYQSEGKYLDARFGTNYSGHAKLLSKMSFLFTNANPYLDFPRPLIHKTVEIGGITVESETLKLNKKWDRILSERPHTVYISFGSVAKSKDMPDHWKHSILAVCASMPNVTFIWKYEEPINLAGNFLNVYLSSWLPQQAFLADPRMSLFITHGGLGSTTEVAYFGKPAIIVPLFADQPRNGQMLARHGGALILDKVDLGHSDVLKKAIVTVLENRSYQVAANKLANLLAERPISPQQLTLRHAEFVAKFGQISQLDPYSRHLSIIQYLFVDVLAGLLLVIALALISLYLIIRSLVQCCRISKLKIQ